MRIGRTRCVTRRSIDAYLARFGGSVTKAANNRSSIYKGKAGSWHSWVSFGEGPDGGRRRKHVRAQTKREVAEKVQRLQRQRAGGYAGDRCLSVNEWLEGSGYV